MLALTATTGKIGGATLRAILDEKLFPPSELVLCTSSDPNDARFNNLKSQGAQVRRSNYDDLDSMIAAFAGCSKLFLVSTPKIEMDFHDAPHGQGREKAHFAAIEAARKAGVQHVYYTSLAFGAQSNAGVMRAHLRTEALLKSLGDIKYTIIREGLYNESWPLYLGYYDLEKDNREEVVLAGDGAISWTAIEDLGLATALVIAESSAKYEGKTMYLSASDVMSLKEIAALVSKVKGTHVGVKTVSPQEYVRHYVDKGSDQASVEWWSSTYAALEDGECCIKDSEFGALLSSRGRQPKPVQETVKEMLDKKS